MNINLNKRSQSLIFLNRQQLVFTGKSFKSPLTLDLPQRVVNDLEIMDYEAFDNLVAGWLTQNQIPPGETVVVFSPSVYYQKDLPIVADATQKATQIDSFLDLIPFKNIYSKEYPAAGKIKLIALNRDFYEPILRILKKNSFEPIALVPAFVLESLKISLQEFSAREVGQVYSSLKQLSSFSLINSTELDKLLTTKSPLHPEDKARMTVLLVVFALLWVVLLAYIFVYPRLFKPKKSNLIVPPPAAIATAAPSPAPLPEPTLTLAAVRIKVINSTGIAGLGTTVKNLLAPDGYQDIAVETGPVVKSVPSIISRSSISPEIIAKIKTTLAADYPEFEEKSTTGIGDFDIIISLTVQ